MNECSCSLSVCMIMYVVIIVIIIVLLILSSLLILFYFSTQCHLNLSTAEHIVNSITIITILIIMVYERPILNQDDDDLMAKA